MMKIGQLLYMTAVAASLSACYVVPMESGSRVVQTTSTNTTQSTNNEVVLTARLYPNNATAQAIGTGHATITIMQNGHGTFRANVGSEIFTGDATRNINSRSGKANGVGVNGRYVSCDYTMNSDIVGTGTCRLSTGATYAMHISR